MGNVARLLRFHLFGSPEVHIADAPLELHSHKALALLFYLAATRQIHTREHLSALLWSDAPDSNARHSLRSSLYHIRQCLQVQDSADRISIEGNNICIKLAVEACDITLFQQLLNEDQEGALLQAIALYRGRLLQGFTILHAPLFEEWQRFTSMELERKYLAALQRLASLAEQRHAWDKAILYLQRLIERDPLTEEGQQHLIRLYIQSGEIGRAWRQYNHFTEELRRELDLAPSPAIQTLIYSALETRRHTPTSLSPQTSAQLPQRSTQQTPGPPEKATYWYQQHLALTGTFPEPTTRISIHFELGELALVANDYEAAATAAQAGLAVAQALNLLHPQQRTTLIARGQRLLGAALAMEGSDLPTAEHHLQEAIAAHRLTQNFADLCVTLFELGNVAAQRGELIRAITLYQEAAQSAEIAPSYYFHALALNNIAYHSLLLGRLDDACSALDKGIHLAETYKLFGALLHLWSTQGEIYLYQGEWETAAEIFRRGLSLAKELGNLERQAGYRAGLALAFRGLKRLNEAQELLLDALVLIDDHGYWHLRARLSLWLAEIGLQQKQLDKAEHYLETALTITHAHGRTLLLIHAQRLQARLLLHRDRAAANTLFAQTIELASHAGLELEVAHTQDVWNDAILCHNTLLSSLYKRK